MSATLRTPEDFEDPKRQADWMELNSILDVDHSSSIEDVISLLTTSGSPENIESSRANLSLMLQERQGKIGKAYPFKFDGKKLTFIGYNKLKGKWAYLFCLLLSYVGPDRGHRELKVWNQQKITRLFEQVSFLAAKKYFVCEDDDTSLLFAGPRKAPLPKKLRPFRQALEHIKAQLNEGEIKGRSDISASKDRGLDILLWKNFKDRRSGKILFFGQCAAGKDYFSKKSEIYGFFNYFLPRSDFLTGFFIPHEIDHEEWADISENVRTGSMVFDRSRISYCAQHWDGQGFRTLLQPTLKKLALSS